MENPIILLIPTHFMQRTAKCFQKIALSTVCLLCNWVT